MGIGLRCARGRSAINLLTAKLFSLAFPCLIRKNVAHNHMFDGTLIDHGERPITARSIYYVV